MPYSNPTDKFSKSLECLVAESITKQWGKEFLYNSQSHEFIMLNTKTGTWFHLEPTQVTSLIRGYLHQTSRFLCPESTKAKFYGSVMEHLKLCNASPVKSVPGIMTQTKFFNFMTCQGEERDSKQYCFNYIDQPFEVEQPMDPEVVEFLKALCNYDNLQLHVLRLFFKCTLLGENPSQTVLFLMGPGQTGKFTFAKMLMSILKETSCSLELNRLSGRFETSRILGKQFLVLGDVDPHGLTSKRASLVKLLSSQEPIVGERKHQNTVNFVFEGNILIHGNSYFELLDKGPKDSTGLARRIVKFPCNTVPVTPNSQLPTLLEKNLVRIIWWALTCDLPSDYFLGKISSLNEVLDQDVEDDMRAFILNNIYVNTEALTALGAKEIPPPYSLYDSYIRYCIRHDYEACSWSRFSTLFLITLRSLRVQVTKVRMTGGRFVKGVSLTEGRPVPVPDKSFAEELRAKDPFNRCNAQKEDLSIFALKTEELLTHSESIEDKPVPEPRKRGRPRKNVESSLSSDEKATQSIPRKSLKSPKVQKESRGVETRTGPVERKPSPSTRKRGRPRKVDKPTEID